jgi:excisionase family DNA binding protein
MSANITSEPTHVPVLISTTEAASLLGCRPQTLAADRVRRGWKVPFLRVGRLVRYDRAAVLRWLAERNPAASMEA